MEKRKRRELKKKAKVRTAQLLAAEGGEATGGTTGAPDDEQLFGLGVLDAAAAAGAGAGAGAVGRKGGKASAAAAAAAAVLRKVSSAAAPDEQVLELLEASDEGEEVGLKSVTWSENVWTQCDMVGDS